MYDAASSNSRLEDGKEDGLQNVENVGNQRKTPGGGGSLALTFLRPNSLVTGESAGNS